MRCVLRRNTGYQDYQEGLGMKKKTMGFTLAEILIVVVLLAVLAAIVLPRYISQKERGIVAEAVAHLSAIRQAEAAWSLEQPTPGYTADLTLLDVDVNASTNFSYAVVAATGTATATRLPKSGTCSSTNFGNCIITLTAAGVWGGDHPFKPT